jgi:glycerol transport system ATP-binding protein
MVGAEPQNAPCNVTTGSCYAKASLEPGAVKLELLGVSRKVGTEEHLYPLELSLAPGLNVLLGPTLAGKTSLLRLLAGLDRPTTGRILLGGQDVTRVAVQRRSVAFVYQQFINYPSLSVFDNIASPLRVKGRLSRQQIADKVQRVAQTMRLEPFLQRLPAELSGGQQQRTAIARALVKEADVVLLDEPLVNLDYKLREELRTELQRLFSERPAIVVYATTEPYEALLLGGNTVVMHEGRVLQSGPALEVYHRPASRRVGEVFSDPPMNLLGARVSGQRLTLAAGPHAPLPPHMQALPEGRYQLGVRAPHTSLRAGAAGDLAVPATVELSEISGSETFVHVSTNGAPTEQPASHLVAQLEGVHPFSVGQRVTLYLDPRRLFVFDGSGALQAAPERAAQPSA